MRAGDVPSEHDVIIANATSGSMKRDMAVTG